MLRVVRLDDLPSRWYHETGRRIWRVHLPPGVLALQFIGGLSGNQWITMKNQKKIQRKTNENNGKWRNQWKIDNHLRSGY